jgi:hypothetical protein
VVLHQVVIGQQQVGGQEDASPRGVTRYMQSV